MGIKKARLAAMNGREFMPSGAMFAGWCKQSPVKVPAHKTHQALPDLKVGQRERNIERMSAFLKELGIRK